mgnify:CR=1 FL=1
MGSFPLQSLARVGKDAVAKPRDDRKARRLEGVLGDLFDGCAMSRMRGVLRLVILMAEPDEVKPNGLDRSQLGMESWDAGIHLDRVLTHGFGVLSRETMTRSVEARKTKGALEFSRHRPKVNP